MTTLVPINNASDKSKLTVKSLTSLFDYFSSITVELHSSCYFARSSINSPEFVSALLRKSTPPHWQCYQAKIGPQCVLTYTQKQKIVDNKNNFHKYNGIFESGKFLYTYSKIRLQVYFLKLFNFTRLRPKDQISSRHQGTLTNRKKKLKLQYVL